MEGGEERAADGDGCGGDSGAAVTACSKASRVWLWRRREIKAHAAANTNTKHNDGKLAAARSNVMPPENPAFARARTAPPRLQRNAHRLHPRSWHGNLRHRRLADGGMGGYQEAAAAAAGSRKPLEPQPLRKNRQAIAFPWCERSAASHKC